MNALQDYSVKMATLLYAQMLVHQAAVEPVEAVVEAVVEVVVDP